VLEFLTDHTDTGRGDDPRPGHASFSRRDDYADALAQSDGFADASSQNERGSPSKVEERTVGFSRAAGPG